VENERLLKWLLKIKDEKEQTGQIWQAVVNTVVNLQGNLLAN
jgi:hypothetical protein